MWNLCCCCKENVSDYQEDDNETNRLINNHPFEYDSMQPIDTEQTSPKEEVSTSSGDVATIMTDIIKGVENQVVDAGTNDVNILEQQDYAARTNYYSEQFSDRFPLPVDGQGLPNTTGRPSSILAAPTLPSAKLNAVREVARRTTELIGDMCPQEKEDLIVQFDST